MPDALNPRSQIHTEQAADRVTLFASGVIDHESITMWDRCVSDVLDARPTAVTLDLSALTFLASAGMRLIVDLRHQMATAGIDFAIGRAPAKIMHVLRITGLIDPAARTAP